MQRSKDYIQEVQRFTTSHYWNSGVRITTGVIVPMLVMVHFDWLSVGIPFLFGALFVSLTDTPGPIHHRRNGMLVATALNVFTVLITSLLSDYPSLLLAEVIIFSFTFSLIGIYGARAAAIGTLALVIMLIQMSPIRNDQQGIVSAALTAGGGLWYTMLSLTLYRLQPYRLAEQALGENLLLIAAYIKARGAFYTRGTNIDEAFSQVMTEQVAVLKAQNQMRELLFKTRQFVADASPKSRSIMMIFLESLDLFEETMYSYQDYKVLVAHTDEDLLNKFYKAILHVVAEFEHIALSVQSGIPVRRMPNLNAMFDELDLAIQRSRANFRSPVENQNLVALRQTLSNLKSIVTRLDKIVLYTRMEAHDPTRFPDQEIEKPEPTQPYTFALVKENLTLRSNNFRYALRISLAMLAGYSVSALFSLSHAYWVMLTIITILKPVYNITRERNKQRVVGTLTGIVLGSVIVFFVSNTTVLVVTMILSMLMAYSLLRINYLGFVTFLTVYIIITFHFLNPLEFRDLIGERMIDTLIGSVIAAVAARFILPVWQQHQIQPVMKKSLIANINYFLAAWNIALDKNHSRQYNAARNEAIVALTNLSDNFQQMLAEPGSVSQHSQVHQFVIASHTLTSRISSLSLKDLSWSTDMQLWVEKITDILQQSVANLEDNDASNTDESPRQVSSFKPLPTLHPLSIILSLAQDIRTITKHKNKIISNH